MLMYMYFQARLAKTLLNSEQGQKLYNDIFTVYSHLGRVEDADMEAIF